jgi:hypothetical protein
MQVHQPYELRMGDRVTIGESTLVLEAMDAGSGSRRPAARRGKPIPEDGSREQRDRVLPAAAQPVKPDRGRADRLGEARITGRGTAGFWIAQALLTLAVICMAAGALLPWLKIEGSLSQDLGPQVQALTNIVASISGSSSLYNVEQTIDGLQGYGKLVLALAFVALIGVTVEIFFYRKSLVPGIVYLVAGLVAAGAIVFDLLNYYRLYQQAEQLSILFGVRLEDVVHFFDRWIDFRVVPLAGLFLTGVGLFLLLVGGVVRLAIVFLSRREGSADAEAGA